MNPKLRKIEVDAETADLLHARAAARGLTVSQLLADLVNVDDSLPPDLAEMREAGRGPWAPELLADDARRLAEFQRARQAVPWDEVKIWLQSWGTVNELPPPKSRKL